MWWDESTTSSYKSVRLRGRVDAKDGAAGDAAVNTDGASVADAGTDGSSVGDAVTGTGAFFGVLT